MNALKEILATIGDNVRRTALKVYVGRKIPGYFKEAPGKGFHIGRVCTRGRVVLQDGGQTIQNVGTAMLPEL